MTGYCDDIKTFVPNDSKGLKPLLLECTNAIVGRGTS